MRFLTLAPVACCIALAMPMAAHAQNPPGLVSPESAGAGSQAPAQPATPAAPTGLDTMKSLFDQTWNQFQLGGRFTSVSGDPARFQRYQDLRDGVVFTDARFAKEDAAGEWHYRLTADNVGYRDQRYSGVYERTGKLVISGLWDEIPQFYS